MSVVASASVTKFGEMKRRILLFSILLLFSCEEEKVDILPPEMVISSPANGETVYEIVTISCTITDDEGVSHAELWVPGDTTAVIDKSDPYSFEWNTNELENGSYTLKLKAVDINDNADSSSLTLIVDNTLALPAPVDIRSISYTLSSMTILFYRSIDDDFAHYELFSSSSDNGQKTLLGQINSIDDTSLTITSFDPTVPTWYWLKVTDIYDYFVFSDAYYVLDDEPTAVTIYQPGYRNGYLDLSWSMNSDDDFSAYIIYTSGSDEMTGKSEVARISSQDNTSHSMIVDITAPVRYYQVVVEDHWEYQTESNIELGKMPFSFMKIWGGSESDRAYSVRQTLDGGYIIAGSTSSYGAGGTDVLLYKADSQGNYAWSRTFGGPLNDKGSAVFQTSDGGYIVTGYTSSFGSGDLDVWLIKTDGNGQSCNDYTTDGNCSDSSTRWVRVFGATGSDYGNAVYECSDGGYIVTGKSARNPSILLIKTDSNGNQEWDDVYGSSVSDVGYHVEQTGDSGILLTGKETSSFGNTDLSLIKVGASGTIELHSTFGGAEQDAGYYFSGTSDGGFIIAGATRSYGNGQWDDMWLIKSSAGGSMEWQSTFGSNYGEQGHFATQNDNGGFIISGFTESIGQGFYDIWVVWTDHIGEEIASQTFGGGSDDKCYAGDNTDDGGIVIVGYTESYGNGSSDIFLMKIDPDYEP